MARGGDVEKGEASSRKRLALPENNDPKSERAKKKARPIETVFKLSRKRVWNEVTETENLNDSHRPSRKALRVGSMKTNGGDGEDPGSGQSRDLKPNHTKESVSTLWEKGDVQGPEHLPQRKWKRTPKVANSDGLASNQGPSDSFPEKQPITEHEHEPEHDYEKVSIGLEDESAGIVSSLEQTALNGRDRKRREAGKGEGSSPPRQLQKKPRVDIVAEAEAEASHRAGEHRGTGVTHPNTWKRLKRHNNIGNSSTAASEDMAVSISEAWKRLRDEKDEKDTETSGSSVNGRGSDSDLSMHSCPEWVEECVKKARYESPLAPPVQGRKWKRQIREKKQSSSSKRLRDGNDGCESPGGSSGSDVAQFSGYLHNRKWKRPRYENLMSVQGRSLRRQSRDGEEARGRSRKRV